jgi:hypothetical protein
MESGDANITIRKEPFQYPNYEVAFNEFKNQIIFNTDDFNTILDEIEKTIKIYKQKLPFFKIEIFDNIAKISYQFQDVIKKEYTLPIKHNSINNRQIAGNLIMPLREDIRDDNIKVFDFFLFRRIMNNVISDRFAINYNDYRGSHQVIDI